uniref:Uncharacterized protein n=1 Tax=Desulfovibrio sp. U5L TaxID=596152 RepID=I2Q036_9BACT
MSEFSRKLDHHNGEAILKVYRRAFPSERAYCIKQIDAWKFSEEHNPDFTGCIAKAALEAYNHLGMGGIVVSGSQMARRCADLATCIQEGIDDLIHAKAAPEERRSVVGEAVVRLGDVKRTVELLG